MHISETVTEIQLGRDKDSARKITNVYGLFK